jgi:hypothetical protein
MTITFQKIDKKMMSAAHFSQPAFLNHKMQSFKLLSALKCSAFMDQMDEIAAQIVTR